MIPREMAYSLSQTLARRISLGGHSTSEILERIFALNKLGELNLRNISVMENPPYLVSAIMPDDPFHHKFAERYYGGTFGHLVRFENIWVRGRQEPLPDNVLRFSTLIQ